LYIQKNQESLSGNDCVRRIILQAILYFISATRDLGDRFTTAREQVGLLHAISLGVTLTVEKIVDKMPRRE